MVAIEEVECIAVFAEFEHLIYELQNEKEKEHGTKHREC